MTFAIHQAPLGKNSSSPGRNSLETWLSLCNFNYHNKLAALGVHVLISGIVWQTNNNPSSVSLSFSPSFSSRRVAKIDFNFVRLSGCFELKRKKDKDTWEVQTILGGRALICHLHWLHRTGVGSVQLMAGWNFVSCFAIRKKFFLRLANLFRSEKLENLLTSAGYKYLMLKRLFFLLATKKLISSLWTKLYHLRWQKMFSEKFLQSFEKSSKYFIFAEIR